MFRTMRFLFIICFILALIMFTAGLGNAFSLRNRKSKNMSFLDHFSLANVVSSGPVCVQQYLNIGNETNINGLRYYDCNVA